MHRLSLFAGLLLLLGTWVWPLPSLPIPPFSQHMLMHMFVVALAAPLLAWGVAQGKWDPVRYVPDLFSPIVASMIELVAVWAWHVPALHHFARHDSLGTILEQSTFLLTGFYLWMSALGGTTASRRQRSAGSMTGLLLTSMHMTLLGVLLALPQRILFTHHHHGVPTFGWLTPLEDQQLGGVVMLLLGGLVYLVGGLCLTADTLRWRST